MAGRSYSTEAVVLRSIRFGEADRVLHLYTADRGRIGAVAKGVRKTKSRFGGRLEPVRSHQTARDDYYRLSVGLIGAEAMLRLFTEQERNERAFTALTRFLDLLDETPHAAERPTLDPLGLSFQLKLLWLSGYLPHLTSCVECGADGATLAGYSPRAGGAVCRTCAPKAEALALSAEGIVGVETLLSSPLADAASLGLSERATREALRIVTASYEYNGGFRLRTLSA